MTPAVSTIGSGVVGNTYDSGAFDMMRPYLRPYFGGLYVRGMCGWCGVAAVRIRGIGGGYAACRGSPGV